MDKSGAKFKFVGHSTEIIRQSKNKGTLPLTCLINFISNLPGNSKFLGILLKSFGKAKLKGLYQAFHIKGL